MRNKGSFFYNFLCPPVVFFVLNLRCSILLCSEGFQTSSFYVFLNILCLLVCLILRESASHAGLQFPISCLCLLLCYRIRAKGVSVQPVFSFSPFLLLWRCSIELPLLSMSDTSSLDLDAPLSFPLKATWIKASYLMIFFLLVFKIILLEEIYCYTIE